MTRALGASAAECPLEARPVTSKESFVDEPAALPAVEAFGLETGLYRLK